MNNDFILTRTDIYKDGKLYKIRYRNELNEWEEQIPDICSPEEMGISATPPSFKRTTIIDYIDDNICMKSKYDSLGRIAKIKFYENNKLTDYTEFKYITDNITLSVTYKPPRIIESSLKEEYYQGGNLKRRSVFYANGDLMEYTDWIYNNLGQNNEIYTYNNKSIITDKILKFYNDNGIEIKTEFFTHKDYYNKPYSARFLP